MKVSIRDAVVEQVSARMSPGFNGSLSDKLIALMAQLDTHERHIKMLTTQLGQQASPPTRSVPPPSSDIPAA